MCCTLDILITKGDEKMSELAREGVLEWLIIQVGEMLDQQSETITAETKFADLGADSLDLAEIVMNAEENYGITIPGKGTPPKTVNDAVDAIMRQAALKTN